MLSRLQRYPFPLVAAALAVAALVAAWVSQYGFGLHPCELCLLQRYPYLGIVALGLLGTPLLGRHSSLRWPLAGLLMLLFLADAGIAAYHVGVEQGWIVMSGGCSGGLNATSIETLRAQLSQAALVSCKDAGFHFGLTMAGWNLLYALGSAVLVAYLARKEESHAPSTR